MNQILNARQAEAVDADTEIVRHIVEALARGDHPISRFTYCPHFTVDFEGAEVVLTSELREKVERKLGCKLVERTEKYPRHSVCNLVASDREL